MNVYYGKRTGGGYDIIRSGRKESREFACGKKYDTVSHDEVLRLNLKVMDATAASLCMDNNIQILVFNLDDPQNIVSAMVGETIGTIVK